MRPISPWDKVEEISMTTVNKRAPIPGHLTTGIGSLPHHNVDSAIEFAFRFGLPFLPQIPIRHPGEFMLPQALDGLPGMSFDADGFVTVDLIAWESGAHAFGATLDAAFRS